MSRSAGVDKQVREGVDKNEFLTHLEEVDSGKMAVEVWHTPSVLTHAHTHSPTHTHTQGCRQWAV